MPSGEHMVGAPLDKKLFRVPEGAGGPGSPFMIEVRDSASYEWNRSPAAQGGRAVETIDLTNHGGGR